jgi:hypothetical protein
VKVGVRCSLSARRIVVPVFLKETINCKIYVQVILRKFFPDLTEEESLYDWFQQDSATAHTACMSLQALSDIFGDRNIRVVYSQHVHPILILVIFPSGLV